MYSVPQFEKQFETFKLINFARRLVVQTSLYSNDATMTLRSLTSNNDEIFKHIIYCSPVQNQQNKWHQYKPHVQAITKR